MLVVSVHQEGERVHGASHTSAPVDASLRIALAIRPVAPGLVVFHSLRFSTDRPFDFIGPTRLVLRCS